MKKNKTTISAETQDEAMKIAKATQKPGQTKEQTKLVAQGIEKGIAQYKKQQKEKARQANKAKKKNQKERASAQPVEKQIVEPKANTQVQEKSTNLLPWILLILSWIGFAAYLFAG